MSWRADRYVGLLVIRGEDAVPLPMLNATAIRYRREQALRWRDLLWASILDDFARRDATRAQRVREALAEQPTRVYLGHSTALAAAAWPYLDAQARADWIWVKEFVHYVWYGMRWTPGERPA